MKRWPYIPARDPEPVCGFGDLLGAIVIVIGGAIAVGFSTLF